MRYPIRAVKSEDQYLPTLEFLAPFFFKKYVPYLHAVWETREVDHARFTNHIDAIDASVDEIMRRIHAHAQMLRRCFFTAPHGPFGWRIGCGSDAVRPGDEIFVLYGVESPIAILRVGNQGHYKYVGNCHLNGIMKGEAPELGLPVEDIRLV